MTDSPAGGSEASNRPLSVLLFSPVRGRDPASGDVAYTEALLGEPPPGVRYTTYAQALEDGLLEIRGRRPRPGTRRATIDLALFGVRGVELTLRRAGVMYREPTWFVSLRPGAFDLVHQHLFAVRQVGPRLPVVSSAGYPLPELYAARDRWSPARLRLATALEWRFDQLMDVHNPWLRGTAGNVMTAYTERFRQYLVARGDVDRRRVAFDHRAAGGRDPRVARRRLHDRLHRSRLRGQGG